MAQEKLYLFLGMSHEGEPPEIKSQRDLATYTVRGTCPQRAASKAKRRVPGETQGIIVFACTDKNVLAPRLHAYVYNTAAKGVQKCQKASYMDHHEQIAVKMLRSAVGFMHGEATDATKPTTQSKATKPTTATQAAMQRQRTKTSTPASARPSSKASPSSSTMAAIQARRKLKEESAQPARTSEAAT